MKFAQNNHPTRLFGPTCLFGTWEYSKASCHIVCNQIQTLTGVGYWTPFFDGVSKLQGCLVIGKRFSLKFLKCDQLTKVREQQYLYRVCRKSPWEKDFSLGKTSLVTANSLRLGPHGWPWPWPVGRANLLTTPPRRNTMGPKPLWNRNSKFQLFLSHSF